MESDKKVSQSERAAPWANMPFSMMAPSTLPLSPAGLSQVWKRPYLMNHFENGEGSGGAETRFQNLDSHTNTTTTFIPTPTSITTTTPSPSATTPEVEAMKDKGKELQDESENCDANQRNDSKTVAVKTEKEDSDYSSIGGLLQIRVGRNIAPESLDPRRLKRIYSNRVSAQKSRLKKLQYIVDMEKKARALEAQVAVLYPQVEFVKNQNYFLQMERAALKESISAYAAKKLHNEAVIEANKKEVQRLRLLHLKQFEQQKRQLQARTLMNMDGVGSTNPRMVMNYPGSSSQSELGKMIYNSYSKQAPSFENAAAQNLQNQMNEMVEQKPDVKPCLGGDSTGNNEGYSSSIQRHDQRNQN